MKNDLCLKSQNKKITELNWVIGLITFLVPSIPMRVRAKVLPLHTYMGLFIFACALIAVVSGITEKNLFSNLAFELVISESMRKSSKSRVTDPMHKIGFLINL
ncbi:hypothetical protein ACTXT7_002801 [Hymenolepis weldensis]